ncbi:factor-independent urate hydroxylase [Alkalicoccobacillus porphyridii]|uniref:Uricase n=1 Tax=Alkalicoccobacillus porphyridii TaxID=2597270 RepID=A0A554A3T0_9BACI|nr:urate oxidase [Alkalicoccobacillus porphyridii]TSB48316.1 urate oxidase [Alkalicoccobacillus porphyridii]
MGESERGLSYGKGNVLAYRTYLKPLAGVLTIPESDFTGRSNILFATNIQVTIGGGAFLSSFTEGDNSLVVATDSMKNFIQRHLGLYDGATLEGFLDFTARAFLDQYPHISTVELAGNLLSFENTSALTGDKAREESSLVFKQSHNDHSTAFVKMERSTLGYTLVNQKSGLKNLELIKVQGNSFSGFIRDEYTTLPEDSNRPLFVYLTLDWTYEHEHEALGDNPKVYVASEQVRDLITSVFHQTKTKSIQHLIYVLGCEILTRFPSLRDVSFQSQNHTWDLIVEDIPDSDGKVFTEPRPPYGFQTFTVKRDDIMAEPLEQIAKGQS